MKELIPTIDLVPGNPRTQLLPIQEFLLPYLDLFKFGYWMLFWGVLFYLLFKFLLIPTFKDTFGKNTSKKS